MGFRPPHLAALRRAHFAGRSPLLGDNRLLFSTARLPIVIPLVEHQYYTLISRRWHGGHSSDGCDHSHVGIEREKAEGVFRLGLAADVSLSVGKALTGYICGSTAIIADAAHSASDVVLSSIALLSYRAAKAPKDNKHPYGHGKFESLGALGISCMLLGTAGGIAWHAFDVLQGVLVSAPDMINHTLDHHNHNHGHGGHHHGFDLDHPILALSMTFLSISVKEGLYWITKRAGEKQGSGLMKANAWHHRADAVSSVVALVGVGGSLLGVPFVDPLAGIVVAGMIFKAGIESGYQSVMELVDAGAPQTVLAPIRQTINQVEDVKERWDINHPSWLSHRSFWCFLPPLCGWVKTTADGALLPSHLASTGVIIKDELGKLLISTGQNFHHWHNDQTLFEAILSLKNIMEPLMLEGKRIIIEGDNVNVINFLRRSMGCMTWQTIPLDNLSFAFLTEFR